MVVRGFHLPNIAHVTCNCAENSHHRSDFLHKKHLNKVMMGFLFGFPVSDAFAQLLRLLFIPRVAGG